MKLDEKLSLDLKNAMKEKNQAALRTIRAVKSALLLAKTDGSGQEIDDKKEVEILQKLMKQRQESYDIYLKQMREDLAAKEWEEMEILRNYLPEQLSEEELIQYVSNLIEETGIQSVKEMGKLMGKAAEELAGKADNKSLANIVKKLLSGM
jgi:uncharacterized protein YqeY